MDIIIYICNYYRSTDSNDDKNDCSNDDRNIVITIAKLLYPSLILTKGEN